MRYFILIKKRGAKKWLGAVPARKGVSLSRLKRIVPKTIKPGYSYRIINEIQLRRFLSRLVPKIARKRIIKKRRKSRR